MTTITLFDLDGVLTRGDTMASLVSRRLLPRPWRLIKAIPLFLITLIAGPQSNLRSAANRRLVTLALKGLSDDDYAQLAASSGERLAAKRTFTNRVMIQRCKDATRQGQTIVVTASERRLARAFLDSAGLETAELVASELGQRGKALTMASHNVGAAKLEALSAAGIDVSGASVYTDSATDIPLAAAAARTYLVNPGTRARKRMQAAVAAVEIIHCS